MKRICFVCTENSNRSQMAEAFTTIHGTENVKAESAGSRPSGVVNARAIATMAEKGYNLNTHRSKSVDSLETTGFDVLVTMGCGDGCPSLHAKERVDWDLPDPCDFTAERFRTIRDIIEQRVIQPMLRHQVLRKMPVSPQRAE
jgi:arsenate reductase